MLERINMRHRTGSFNTPVLFAFLAFTLFSHNLYALQQPLGIINGVIIDGIRVINVGTSYTEDHAAIRVARSDHFTIQNVTLENLFFGIYLEKANNGMGRNNTIAGNAKEEFNSGNGIQLWYSENIQVHNNEISGVRDGIYLEFANNCNLSGNYSHNNIRYGLHFMFSNHDSYSNNTFENNGAGIEKNSKIVLLNLYNITC